MAEQDNAIAVVQQLIRHYNIPVSNQTIVEDLKSHQDYPSLKSICDALNEWKVVNYPMRLDREELRQTEAPFIAHLNDTEEKLAFVPELNGNSKIKYFDSAGKGKVINENDFFDKYSGVSILIEPDEKSGENEYVQKTQEQFLQRSLPYFAGLTFMFLAAYTIVSNDDQLQITTKNIAILFTKVTGLFLSALLVLKDLNIKNSLADRLCGLSKKTNCNPILNTEAAKVLGWIHWSDVGLIYFLSGMLMVISIPSVSDYSLMAIGSFGALFYVFYSIYYQALVAKTWCPLCLGVQAVFIAEVILSVVFLSEMDFSIGSFIKYLSIAGVATFIVVLSKAYFLEFNKSQQQKLNYLKLKRNPDIFINLLKKSERKTLDLNDQVFLIGNKQALVKVTAFLSLRCKPCQKAFNQLKSLVGYESVAVYLIFSLHDDKLKSLINKSGQLFHEKKTQEVIQLLDDWYNTNQMVQIIANCEASKPTDRFDSIQHVHNSLFTSAQINGTPTIFVNGYELPKEYEIADIPNLIDVLSKPIAYR